MQLKRLGLATAVIFGTLFSLSNLFHPLQTASSTPQATTLLYDSSIGTTPNQQNFSYQAIGFPPQATQTYSAPVTILNTANQLTDYAGYTVTQAAMPTLSRTIGFQLSLNLSIISENHSGNNDRAGFSLILLSDDLYGVELSFWEDEIWVQEGNSDLFKHAEGVAYNTTTALTNYEITIISNTYMLAANDVPLLNGNLRQYTDWTPPFGFPNPYEQPNQLFLGDDTSSAGADVWLGDVSIVTDVASDYSLFLPFLNKP